MECGEFVVVQYKTTCRNAVVQVANTFQQHKNEPL